MELAPLLVLGGVVIFLGLYLWLRRRLPDQPAAGDDYLSELPFASGGDALLVARERGRLGFANEVARRVCRAASPDPHRQERNPNESR